MIRYPSPPWPNTYFYPEEQKRVRVLNNFFIDNYFKSDFVKSGQILQNQHSLNQHSLNQHSLNQRSLNQRSLNQHLINPEDENFENIYTIIKYFYQSNSRHDNIRHDNIRHDNIRRSNIGYDDKRGDNNFGQHNDDYSKSNKFIAERYILNKDRAIWKFNEIFIKNFDFTTYWYTVKSKSFATNNFKHIMGLLSSNGVMGAVSTEYEEQIYYKINSQKSKLATLPPLKITGENVSGHSTGVKSVSYISWYFEKNFFDDDIALSLSDKFLSDNNKKTIPRKTLMLILDVYPDGATLNYFNCFYVLENEIEFVNV